MWHLVWYRNSLNLYECLACIITCVAAPGPVGLWVFAFTVKTESGVSENSGVVINRIVLLGGASQFHCSLSFCIFGGRRKQSVGLLQQGLAKLFLAEIWTGTNTVSFSGVTLSFLSELCHCGLCFGLTTEEMLL